MPAGAGEAGVRASRRPGPPIGDGTIGRSDGRSLAQGGPGGTGIQAAPHRDRVLTGLTAMYAETAP